MEGEDRKTGMLNNSTYVLFWEGQNDVIMRAARDRAPLPYQRFEVLGGTYLYGSEVLTVEWN